MFENLEWGWDNARALLRLFALIYAVCWAISENRKRAAVEDRPRRHRDAGASSPCALYGIPPLQAGLSQASVVVDALQAATRAGTNFVFGYVGDNTAWTVLGNKHARAAASSSRSCR